MSRAEARPQGRGKRVPQYASTGSVEAPKQGIARWIGQRAGTCDELPRFPPKDPRRHQRPEEKSG